MARRVEIVRPLLVIGLAAVVVACGRVALVASSTRLLVNLTPSEPRGLYRVVPRPASQYVRGMRVVLPVPGGFTSFVVERGWLAPGIPLVKEIGAVAGDRVCVGARQATVNDRIVGPVYADDSAGRALPALRGCFIVRPGEFLPVSTRIPNSFDGRYFGPQAVATIIGEARATWTF